MRKNKRKNNKKSQSNSIEEVVKNTLQPERFDPYGSYTGRAGDGEKPVQDADDL